jgi:Stigma-specific protein, Stig1
MDEVRFDVLTRRLASGLTRRNVLGALAGGATTLGLGGLAADEADAKKKGKKDKKKCNGKSKKRCGGKCVNVNKSAKHCGACGTSCGKGGTCTDGVCTLVVVTDKHLNGWSIRDNTPDGKTNGPVEFIEGPGNPPLGAGSVQFTTRSGPDINDKSTLANATWANTQIADLDTLAYTTYVTSGGASHNIAPAIKLEITSSHIEGGTTGTLIFEPVYFGATESVEEGDWQSWDTLDPQAKWWFTKNVPDPSDPDQYLVCNPNNPPSGCTNQFVPWSQILTALPDATINTLLLETGSGTPDTKGSVDKLQVNDTTYDFEPEP